MDKSVQEHMYRITFRHWTQSRMPRVPVEALRQGVVINTRLELFDEPTLYQGRGYKELRCTELMHLPLDKPVDPNDVAVVFIHRTMTEDGPRRAVVHELAYHAVLSSLRKHGVQLPDGTAAALADDVAGAMLMDERMRKAAGI